MKSIHTLRVATNPQRFHAAGSSYSWPYLARLQVGAGEKLYPELMEKP